MNKAVSNKIKKYAWLRGKTMEGINAKSLKQAYLEASESQRKQFIREMDDYSQAIKDGAIEPGESILHTAYE